MPRPDDPNRPRGIRREWDDQPVAAPPRDPRALPLPTRDRLGGHASQRHLLLPLVLEHAPRRGLRALDAGRASAAVRSGLPVLPCPRAVLQRRPTCAARTDAGHRVGWNRRGRELVVGAGIARRPALAGG